MSTYGRKPDPGDTQPTRRTRPHAAQRFVPGGRGVMDTRPRAAAPPAAPPPRWMIGLLGAGFAVGLAVLAVVVHLAVRDLTVGWVSRGLNPFSPGAFGRPSSSGDGPTPAPPQVEPHPWTGEERVTVLLLGLDYRDWVAGQGPPRTDSMMLITFDPLTNSAGMLSVPRDLWVEIPGFSHNRINTAFVLGESNRLPGGGPGLAMRAVESVVGVPIQFYVVIEFSAFERMIDEIGGVHVLVPEPMRIHPIGGPGMALEAKAYHFNGAQALAYARARSTGTGDFDRASRQQQVVMAIRDRVTGVDMIPTLLMRAPALYQEIAAGIHTNLSLDQMVALGLLALQLEPEDIRRGVIAPPEMVNFEMLPDGAQVLRPIADQIRLLRDEIFTVGGAVGPSIPVEEPVAAANQEGSRVAVRNGAGIEGLATRAADYLRGQGLNVVEVGNADRMDYTTTVIIDYTGNPYTARFLMSLLNLSQSQIFIQTVPDSPVDLAVIVGPDLVVP